MNATRRLFCGGMMLLLIITLLSCQTGQRMESYHEEFDGLGDYYGTLGTPYYESSLPSYYFTGESWTDRAVELIESAESYIFIDTFLIGEHSNAMRIFEALQRAMHRGVAVRLLIDSSSYYRKDRTTGSEVPVPIEAIREMGIPVTEYNPIRAFRIYRLLGLLDRDHRKFWVIDGSTLVVGGMNIDPDSLGFSYERGSVDGMTEIISPDAAAAMSGSFIRTWNAFSLEQLEAKMFPARDTPETLESDVYLFDQDMDERRAFTELIDGIFSQAKESVTMIQCYLILTPGLLARIESAVGRGVDVTVILSANHVSERFTQATYFGIRDLQEAGASVYIYESPTRSLIHTKLITADDRVVAVGSANYNFRSQTTSREISLVFDDQRAYERIQPFVEEVFGYSRFVGSEEAERYRNFSAFLTFLMMQVGG